MRVVGKFAQAKHILRIQHNNAVYPAVNLLDPKQDVVFKLLLTRQPDLLKRTTFIVRDAEASATFYQQVFGWTVWYDNVVKADHHSKYQTVG